MRILTKRALDELIQAAKDSVLEGLILGRTIYYVHDFGTFRIRAVVEEEPGSQDFYELGSALDSLRHDLDRR